MWSKTIEQEVAARKTERGTMFVRAWQLNLLTYTLLADCSRFIADMNAPTKNLFERRLALLNRLDRLEKTWSERCEEKIRAVMGDDAEADLMSMFEKLSEATEFSVGCTINYLNAYPGSFIIFDVLRVALGHRRAMEAADDAHELATWLDSFARREQPHTYYCMDAITSGILRATIETRNEWRDFAFKVETRDPQKQPLVIGMEAMERWLRLAGVTTRR